MDWLVSHRSTHRENNQISCNHCGVHCPVFVFMNTALLRIYWHTAGARRGGHTSLDGCHCGPPFGGLERGTTSPVLPLRANTTCEPISPFQVRTIPNTLVFLSLEGGPLGMPDHQGGDESSRDSAAGDMRRDQHHHQIESGVGGRRCDHAAGSPAHAAGWRCSIITQAGEVRRHHVGCRCTR